MPLSWNPVLRKKARQEQDRRRDDPLTYTTPLPQSKSNNVDGNAQDVVQKFVKEYMNTIDSKARRAWRKEQVLKYPDSVAKHYQLLVKETKSVLHDDFWQRYEYRCSDQSRIIADLQDDAAATAAAAAAAAAAAVPSSPEVMESAIAATAATTAAWPSSSSSVRSRSSLMSSSSRSLRRLLGSSGKNFKKSWKKSKSSSSTSSTAVGRDVTVTGRSNKDNKDVSSWLQQGSQPPVPSLSSEQSREMIAPSVTFDTVDSYGGDHVVGGLNSIINNNNNNNNNTQVLNVTDSILKDDANVPIVVSMPTTSGGGESMLPLAIESSEAGDEDKHGTKKLTLDKTASVRDETNTTAGLPTNDTYAASSSSSRWNGTKIVLAGLLLWCVLLACLLVNLPLSKKQQQQYLQNMLCGPIRPGMQITPAPSRSDGTTPTRVTHQSPWWAPLDKKQWAFDVVCQGSTRADGPGPTELIIDQYPRMGIFTATIAVKKEQKQQQKKVQQLWKASRLQSLSTDGSTLLASKLGGQVVQAPAPWAVAVEEK